MTATALARKRIERAVAANDNQTPALLVQALERAIRAEEQAKAAVGRIVALEEASNRIAGVLGDLRLEVGKLATRVGIWGALGALLGTVVSSVLAAVIVYYVTKGAAR